MPSPGVDCKRSVPPIWSANARTRNRPSPRPAPGRLRGEERLAGARRFVVAHAAAAIDDLDPEAVAVLDAQRHALIRPDASKALRSSAINACRSGSAGTSIGWVLRRHTSRRAAAPASLPRR